MKKMIILAVATLSFAACSTTQENNSEKTTVNEATQNVDAQPDAAKETTDKAPAMNGSQSSCTMDKDTRVIEVKKTEAGGCELFYTKFGESKSVASSGFGTQYCEEVKDRIQTNLNKAGFTCQ